MIQVQLDSIFIGNNNIEDYLNKSSVSSASIGASND